MAVLPTVKVKVKVKVKVTFFNNPNLPIKPIKRTDRSPTRVMLMRFVRSPSQIGCNTVQIERYYYYYYYPMGNDFAAARAKEKYGRGYRKHPPARNRNQWQKFIERNRALAQNNYKSTSKHVQHILQIRERVWNSLPNGNKSRELLSGTDALDYKGVVYALINEETGDCFHIQLPTYIGQSSESVLQRCVRTFDKAQSAAKSGREPVAFKSTWLLHMLTSLPTTLSLVVNMCTRNCFGTSSTAPTTRHLL